MRDQRISFATLHLFLSFPAWLFPVLLVGILGALLTSPLPVSANSNDQLSIVSTGLYHTCGIKTDGRLVCWGYDGYGQVSGPNNSSNLFSQISTGGHHTCGVKIDGHLSCWGNNQYGQVSGPNASLDTFIQIDAGGFHTCGVKTNGQLVCWGNDQYGQVTSPLTSSDTFTQVSTGLYHTCGVKTSGRLACWGADWYEQASGSNTSLDTFIQIDTGGYHTCGVKTNGYLMCWGHDWYGQVSSPIASSDTFTQVSTGLYHTCGVKTSGELSCWGYNGSRQVSGPNAAPAYFNQVSAGGYHTAAITTDNFTLGWGNNDYGQMPPGSNRPPSNLTLSNSSVDENQPINTEVGALTTTDPDAGDTHTYTLVSTGLCPGPDNGSFSLNSDRLRTSIVPNYETKSSYTICLRTDDGQSGAYDRQITITINNVNEAPVIAVPGAQNTLANVPLIFSTVTSNPISISDVDPGDNLIQVTLTTSSGTLTLSNTAGLTFLTGSGTKDAMVFTGTLLSINTVLEGLTFNPTLDQIGPATIQIVAEDLSHTNAGITLTDAATVAITVAGAAAPGGEHRIFLPIIYQSIPASAQIGN